MATAMEAESAVAACAEYEPDVLIVDLRLGSGPNGIDVAHRVRRPGLRIILHTNYVSTATVKAAAGAGAVVVEKGSLRALRRALYGWGGGRCPPLCGGQSTGGSGVVCHLGRRAGEEARWHGQWGGGGRGAAAAARA